MSFVDITDGRIHYRFDGDAKSPVLVLSNSLGTDLGIWDSQAATLSQNFRVLRYDSRGQGGSLVTPAPYTIERLGRDVVGMLDVLKVERAHFCGLSMGGMIGMWLGINAPERVTKLALCNTAALIGTAELWNTRMEAVMKSGMAPLADSVLARWFTPAFLEKAPADVERLRKILLATPAEGYAGGCAAIRDADLRAEVCRIKAPTLVISGSGDTATPPAGGRFLAQEISGSRYVELPAAHMSNIEAAKQFTETLADFLAT